MISLKELSSYFSVTLIFLIIVLSILIIIATKIYCCQTSSNIESKNNEELEIMVVKNSNEMPYTFKNAVNSQRPLNENNKQKCHTTNENETKDISPRELLHGKNTQVLTTFSAEFQTFNNEFLHFENKELIGEGAFGNVYKCLYMESNRYCYVAVKEPKKSSYEAFEEENIMMRISDHPNIIKLITTRIGDSMRLVMPLLKCNLSQFLFCNNNQKPSIGKRSRYCHQIAQGMTYLMFKQIVHCDLKASNILVVDENAVQISDFGKAHLMGSKKCTTGTITHTAIELLDPSITRAVNSEATDIWSFGVTIWEIFNENEQIPYKDEIPHITEITLLDFLYSGKHLKTTYWPSKETSPSLITIESYMKRCLVHKKELRPSFVEMWEIFETMLPEGQLRKYKLSSNESEC